MKAVILAAGESTRCYPLTLTRPKPLLVAAGKTLLEHNLDALNGLVDEVMIVVGYKKEMIIKYGPSYKELKLTYVEQKSRKGTAHALLQCKGLNEFVVMYGDDIYSRQDIKECIKHRHALLAKQLDDASPFGLVIQKEGKLDKIIEKPEPAPGLVNIGLYALTNEIFAVIEELDKSERGEFELTDAVNELDVHVVKAKKWLPNAYPWHLLESNKELLKELKHEIHGEVEKGVVIKGKVHLGKGSILKSGTYIEGNVFIGENTEIGPHSYIRGSTSIGDNCKVGNAVEIKNTIIMNNSKVPHLSYVGDSVLGENVNFGASTITANLRHDHNNIKSMVKGKLIDTGRRKLGVIVGDNVHTGIHTSIYPGRKIWPNQMTRPGEKVVKDIQ